MRRLVLCNKSFCRTLRVGGPVSPAVFREHRTEGKINVAKSENPVLLGRSNLKTAKMFFVSIVNYRTKRSWAIISVLVVKIWEKWVCGPGSSGWGYL